VVKMEYENNILKLFGEYLCRPLAHIYNRSLALGKFPDCFNYSVVNPLYQIHEKSVLSNYRPISLLDFPRFFKYWYFEDWINIYKIIMYFCLKSLVFENMYQQIMLLKNLVKIFWMPGRRRRRRRRRKQDVAGFFCDLTKAFNCVNH